MRKFLLLLCLFSSMVYSFSSPFNPIISQSSGYVVVKIEIAENHHLYADNLEAVGSFGVVDFKVIGEKFSALDSFTSIERGFYKEEVVLIFNVDDVGRSLNVSYQGCEPGVVCYLPAKASFNFRAGRWR